MEKMERPKLGTLKPGDPVIVIERIGGRGRSSEHSATVAKVARVWVTVKLDHRSGWNAEKRFRLDDQTSSGQYGYRDRFVTPEQHAYDERMRAARKVLTDAGVRLDHYSPFSKDDAATLALAERVVEIVTARVATEREDSPWWNV